MFWPLNEKREGDASSQLIGSRLKMSSTLGPGTPIWVRTKRTDAGELVTDIRLSQAWRDVGKFSIRERLGEALPCVDPTDLCPSCRLLGSAGDDERPVDRATQQNSYRGHVRFYDAVAVEEPTIHKFSRAPLSSPKPSAGQFYLDNAGWTGKASTEPLAKWGSEADTGGIPRGIRGRKFYWATRAGTPGQIPGSRHRSHRQDHHRESQVADIELIAAGAVFSTRIAFDNVSPADLGSLLCAVDPNLAWPARDGKLVTRLGGGRPFGWGAVKASISDVHLECASERYLGLAPPADDGAPNAADCVNDFLDHGLTRNASQLCNLLTLDYVSDRHVHYPNDLGNPLGEPNFDFWKATSGQELADAGLPEEKRRRPLTPLPDASAPPSEQGMSVEGI
ncbi:MAG: hypothetical protein V9G19_10340 [Tetrasphaera sp.]